jgi:hypothetical protein
MYSSHYDCSQELKKLNRLAASRAAELIKRFTKKEYRGFIPMLVYSGMSGIAFATAIGIHLEKAKARYVMAYVRKKNENSHGEKIEYTSLGADRKYQLVFVDDFICSGDTFNYVISRCVASEQLPSNIRYTMPEEEDHALTLLHIKGKGKYEITGKHLRIIKIRESDLTS